MQRRLRHGWAMVAALGAATVLVACGGIQPAGAHAPVVAGDGPIQVVAAENFYGNIALQVGERQVTVRSILTDPSADPHDYESSARDAEAVANAQLVVKNGAGYDSFIDKLLSAAPRPSRVVVDASQLAQVTKGDNPHVWYRPDVPKLVADVIADKLAGIDPAHADSFLANAKAFDASLGLFNRRVDELKRSYQGTPVLPTEQVANYLLSAAGLLPAHGEFQRAIEEGNDPPPRAVEEFRQTLINKKVRVLIYNTQTPSKITEQMRKVAEQAFIPVLGVSETLPDGTTFQEWMLKTVNALEAALGSPR